MNDARWPKVEVTGPVEGDASVPAARSMDELIRITAAEQRATKAETALSSANALLAAVVPCIKFAAAWDDCDGVSDDQLQPIIKAAVKAAKSKEARALLADMGKGPEEC